MIKIGIVLATYNGEKYLSQMLDSLLAQTRPADFIVAIDDGSKDDTPNILKGYEGRLPLQVTCLPHNTGHRAAFSKALELAAQQLGEDDLIALADQDDVWLPKKLQILEDTIQKKSRSESRFRGRPSHRRRRETPWGILAENGRRPGAPLIKGDPDRIYQRHGLYDAIQGETSETGSSHPGASPSP